MANLKKGGWEEAPSNDLDGWEEAPSNDLDGWEEVPSNDLDGWEEVPSVAGVSQIKNKSPMDMLGEFIRSQRPANIIGGIPTNRAEAMDIPRVIGRQVPGMRGYDVNPTQKLLWQGPSSAIFDAMLHKTGIKSSPEIISAPNTEYGEGLELGADMFPLVYGAGAGAGAIRSLAKSGKFSSVGTAVKDLFSEKNRLELLNNFRKQAYSSKKSAVEKYGADLEKLESMFPERRVDLTDALSNVKTYADMDPKIKNYLNSVPGLKKLISDPSKAVDIPLKSVQAIQTYLQGKIPPKVYSGSPHPLAPVAEFLTDLKGSKIKSFPELKEANAEYGPIADAFKAIKGKLSKDSLEDFIKGGFKNTEIRDAVKVLMGDSEAYKRANAFKNINTVGKFVLPTAEVGGGLAFLNWLMNRKK